jgi:gamma-glutamyltranspeptidase/glutathione hydrolase
MRTLIYFKTAIFLLLITIVSFPSTKPPVRAENGMVVSASKLASEVGANILQKGGNAVDAAVATGFALAVTHPSAGNIGGGGFMVIHLADGENITLDFREKAPLAATKTMYLDENGNYVPELSRESVSASGVPGSVAGLITAWEKYGNLSFEEVIQPAIELADKGFELPYHLARSFGYNLDEFKKYPASKEVFSKGGKKYNEGDLFVQKDLANTLKLIRDEGKAGFYQGETAELIVETSEKYDGYITLEDLKKYEPVWRKPVTGKYKDHEIVSMGPPSSGGIAIIQTLNAMEEFDFSQEEWGSSDYIHTLSEIWKQVYADRSKHLGDKDFYPVPIDWLTSKEYAGKIASNVGDKAVPADEVHPGKAPKKESTETTHYSVFDDEGNAVSTTVTLNSSYGNKIVVAGAGFLLNNEMDDFSAKPGVPNQFGLLGSEANAIQPEKRMLSSMSPTIVLKEDKPYLIVGSPGGSRIITSVIQVILNVIDFNMDIQQAIDVPRFHHQWKPDKIFYEEFGMSKDIRSNLIAKGQNIGREITIGRVQGILIDSDKNVIFGGSDSRGNGSAEGF